MKQAEYSLNLDLSDYLTRCGLAGRPFRASCRGVLPLCHTGGPSKFSRTEIVFRQPAREILVQTVTVSLFLDSEPSPTFQTSLTHFRAWMPCPVILRRASRLFHPKRHHPLLGEGVGIVTARFVTRVWRGHIATMARRSGHDPPCPVHATFMTGVAAPSRHHPAVDHPRPGEGCRGLMARLTCCCGREVVCRLA